jgi:hypothetical protein
MYKTIEQINGTGVIGILQTNADATVLFPVMFIISIWAIISLGNFYATIRRHNQADFLASLTVGGFVASVIAGLSMIIPNFMPLYVAVIAVIIEIIFAILLFTDKYLKYE